MDEEEYLRVLTKGLITLPIAWREELGIKPGAVVTAKKTGNKITLEPQKTYLPLRVYTDEEINQFVKDDVLPKSLIKKLNAKGIY